MSDAANAKIKLFKEIEELKKKVAERDEIETELNIAKAELERQGELQEQLDQWKADFAEGSKHVNKMKRENAEAKEIAMSLKRKVMVAEEDAESTKHELRGSKQQLKLAEKIREGTLGKLRLNDKEVKKKREENKVYENLRIRAEEELRQMKQFSDQERSFRLQDLHRHNELQNEQDKLEEEKDRLEFEKWKAVRDATSQRAQNRGLQAAVQVNKQMAILSDQEISQQNAEIGGLQHQVVELKRVVQEKNGEISTWSRRFMDLETEYARVKRRLAKVARSASDKSEVITKGRLATDSTKGLFARTEESMPSIGGSGYDEDVGNNGRPHSHAPTFHSKHQRRPKLKEPEVPGFITRLSGVDSVVSRRTLTNVTHDGGNEHVRGGNKYKQPSFDPHDSAIVPSLTKRGYHDQSASSGSLTMGSATRFGQSSTLGSKSMGGSMYVGNGLGLKKPTNYEPRTTGSAKNILEQVLKSYDAM